MKSHHQDEHAELPEDPAIPQRLEALESSFTPRRPQTGPTVTAFFAPPRTQKSPVAITGGRKTVLTLYWLYFGSVALGLIVIACTPPGTWGFWHWIWICVLSAAFGAASVMLFLIQVLWFPYQFHASTVDDEALLGSEDAAGEQWLVQVSVRSRWGRTKDRGVLWEQDGGLAFSGHRSSWILHPSDVQMGRSSARGVKLVRRSTPACSIQLVALIRMNGVHPIGKLRDKVQRWKRTSPLMGFGQLPPLTEYGDPPP